MRTIETNIELVDGRVINKIDFDENTKITISFENSEPLEFDDSAAEVYYLWFEDAVKTNQLAMAQKVFDYMFGPSEGDIEPVTEAADDTNPEDAEPIDDTFDEKPKDEPEEDAEPEDDKLDTVKKIYDYIKDKDNVLDKTLIDKLKMDDPEKLTLGGQLFVVYNKDFLLDDESKVKTRVLIGVEDGGHNIFVCIPDNWNNIVDAEDIDIDEVNKEEIRLNAVLSEGLILKDGEAWDTDVVEYYSKLPAYSVIDEEPEGINNIGEPEGTSSGEEATPASIEDYTSSEPTNLGFESYEIKYKTQINESWLDSFEATDKFVKRVNEYKQRLDKYMKAQLRECVSIVPAESGKFISVRVDKQRVREASLTDEWFKTRLSKTYESIRKLAKGLRIVETRSSYYVRTFFLVESLSTNYCLSESEVLNVYEFKDDKVLCEGSMVVLSDTAKSVIEDSIKNTRVVIKPTLKDSNGGIVESYKVNNDNKKPIIVKVNEEEHIVLVSPDLLIPVAPKNELPIEEPEKSCEPGCQDDQCNPDAEPLFDDGTQASAIAPKVAPLTVDSLFSLDNKDILDKLAGGKEEVDCKSGVVIKLVPVAVKEGTSNTEVLFCEAYGNPVMVVPSRFLPNVNSNRDYLICNSKGNIVTCGEACDRFLKVMTKKYLNKRG